MYEYVLLYRIQLRKTDERTKICMFSSRPTQPSVSEDTGVRRNPTTKFYTEQITSTLQQYVLHQMYAHNTQHRGHECSTTSATVVSRRAITQQPTGRIYLTLAQHCTSQTPHTWGMILVLYKPIYFSGQGFDTRRRGYPQRIMLWERSVDR